MRLCSQLRETMQLISPCLVDAVDYVAEQAHRRVKRPSHCPQCKHHNTLRAIGFYNRSVTESRTGKIVAIKVRRFLCEHCHKTLSLLPSFAQPYRLICSISIERYFNGTTAGADTLQWNRLLRRYRRRFNAWISDLVLIVGQSIGLSDLDQFKEGSWNSLINAYGHLDQATRKLVRFFQITVFGRYRCHSPISPDG